jgi:hypothetical protein
MRSSDELLGMKAPPARSSGPSRPLYRRLQEIQKLPHRDHEALLRTIEAFIAKAD